MCILYCFSQLTTAPRSICEIVRHFRIIKILCFASNSSRLLPTCTKLVPSQCSQMSAHHSNSTSMNTMQPSCACEMRCFKPSWALSSAIWTSKQPVAQNMTMCVKMQRHTRATAHPCTPCNHSVHVNLDALLQANLTVQLCNLDIKTACGTEQDTVCGSAENLAHHELKSVIVIVIIIIIIIIIIIMQRTCTRRWSLWLS